MGKKRIISCGTRFGKMYIEAILDLKADFELVGIVSKNKSLYTENYAKKRKIPLFSCDNKVPDADIACVVLKFVSSGGDGNNIVSNFIENGMHVMVEQPVHYKEYLEMVKLAIKNKRYIAVSNFYRYIDSTKEYIDFIKEFSKIEDVRYINIECSYQLLHPTVAILCDLLDVRNYELDSNVLRSGGFVTIGVNIDGIYCNIRIHNEFNYKDTDNNFYLFYNFKVGFGSGDIVLTDPSGPIYWYSRFHMNKNFEYGDSSSENLIKKNNIIFGNGNNYSDIIWREWKNAISEQLKSFRDIVLKGENFEGFMQKELDQLIIVSEIIKLIGYPRENSFSVVNRERQVRNILFNNRLNGNDFNLMIETLTNEHIDKMIENMDIACVLSVLVLFKKIGIINNERYISIQNLDVRYYKYRYIINRWVYIFERKKYIKPYESMYYINEFLNELDFEKQWDIVRDQWSGVLIDNSMLEYYYSHAVNLYNIFNEEINPTYLLFPEGNIELAENFYNNSLMGKYLNNKISQYISGITDYKTNILEIGAGTGATSYNVLSNIRTKYSEYVFTDVSDYFLDAAKEKLKNFDNIRYEILDMNHDLMEQGIAKESIDIVIIAGAINNTINTKKTLSYINKVMKKGGVLLIAEPVDDLLELQISQLFIMNIPNDDRYKENITFFRENDWLNLLNDAGYKVIDAFPKENDVMNKLKQKLFISRKE